jgi:type IV fimbrial biogenesis protein FimT
MIKQRHTGFTLIELMITLAVLAVLAAIAAPSFSDIMERRKLNGAGENLFATLIFAKTEAIKRNAPVRITFVGTGDTWCYGLAVDAACDCSDNVPACTIDGVTKIVDQDDYSAVSVDAGSSFADSFTAFSPLRGAANNNGTLTFTISNGAEFGVSLSTFGRISLCSDTGTFGYSAC